MKRRSLKQICHEARELLSSDWNNVKWAVVWIIACFAFFSSFWGTVCPLAAITGFPCPGCGLTRAAFCLLRLDFAGAWEMHPFIYPVGGLVIAFLWGRYLCGKRQMAVLARVAVAVAGAMVLYYIWRLCRYFPGEPPMNYYGENLLRRICSLIIQ